MRAGIHLTLVAVCGGIVWAGASAPWQKDFAEWTERDAQAVVKNSPWAKQATMPMTQRPDVTVMEPGDTTADAHPAEGAPTPARTPTTTGKSTVPLRNSAGAPAMQPTATILWASAKPVRLAILKLRSGSTPPTADQITNALKPRPHYVIAVSGFPAPEGGSDPKALASRAFLSVHGKPAVVAIDSDYRKIGDADVYFFRFPREGFDLTASDQQVEFRLTFQKTEIKKKFELSGMLYKGELAL